MKIDNDTISIANEALENVITNITLPVALRIIMSILKRMHPDKDSDWLYDLIHFRASPSLSFQTKDISHAIFSINKEGNGVTVEIELNFLSIFGASSPLPYHYNEVVLQDSHGERILLDFLNMYNHRLKRLIYPIWMQQRYYIQYENDLTDKFSSYVLSILGLNSEAKLKETSLNIHKLLPYAGLLSMKQKSTGSLLSILKHYFSHKDIFIEEGIVSKSIVPEEQCIKLGDKNSSLGLDMSIGTFILTRNQKFRIHFKNVTWTMLNDFSPHGQRRKQLRELMNYIQTDPLD